MLRKRDQRADDRQHFARICELLEIPLSPKKTLARRSECPCIYLIHLFMSEGIMCFLVLVGVEQLVKQRKLDDALRRRLGAGEIDLAVLRAGLAQDSNDTAPGVSDIGAIPPHGLCPTRRDADEGDT